uniref:Uncharacterized protein n=1 Tax=Pyxicephalus adspersus TaxID=30357 RepID=A0AAV3AML2_PYXAD|nr:TPA: hypothetical protein GDO54_014294 [Pyxicephalus adspersus]
MLSTSVSRCLQFPLPDLCLLPIKVYRFDTLWGQMKLHGNETQYTLHILRYIENRDDSSKNPIFSIILTNSDIDSARHPRNKISTSCYIKLAFVSPWICPTLEVSDNSFPICLPSIIMHA